MEDSAFSNNIRQVLDYATALAKRFHCRYIGSEHILFGLINVEDGRAASILREADVTNERFIHYFKETIDFNTIIPGNMFTARTKRLIQKAGEFSIQAHSGFIGTEHLLLALLMDYESFAVSILKSMQVDVDKMAEDLAKSLFGNLDDEDFEQEENILGKTYTGEKAEEKDSKNPKNKEMHRILQHSEKRLKKRQIITRAGMVINTIAMIAVVITLLFQIDLWLNGGMPEASFFRSIFGQRK